MPSITKTELPKSASVKQEITCTTCGKIFTDYPSNHRKVCSRECAKPFIGRTHGESKTPLHSTWCSMNNRCRNPNSPAYPWYGGRGISVCKEWASDFTAFRDWAIANGYKHGLCIDRKDNDLGYSPDNCRWVTHKQNMANTRKRVDGHSSKYKGVSYHSPSKQWKAQISIDGKNTYVGIYRTQLAAALAYDEAAVKHHGEFALLNFQERMAIFK